MGAIYNSKLSWADGRHLRMNASGREYLLQVPSNMNFDIAPVEAGSGDQAALAWLVEA